VKPRQFLIAALAILVVVGCVPPSARAGEPSDGIGLPITEHTLKNGMRLLIVERRESPTFSAYLRFRVGSVNEPAGQTGLAHLLEHMMFKAPGCSAPRTPPGNCRSWSGWTACTGPPGREGQGPAAGGTLDQAAVARLERQIAELEAEAKQFILRNELWRFTSATGASASTPRPRTKGPSTS